MRWLSNSTVISVPPFWITRFCAAVKTLVFNQLWRLTRKPQSQWERWHWTDYVFLSMHLAQRDLHGGNGLGHAKFNRGPSNTGLKLAWLNIWGGWGGTSEAEEWMSVHAFLKPLRAFPLGMKRGWEWPWKEGRMKEKKKSWVGRKLETKDIPHQLLFITQRQQITAQPLINYFSIITSSVKSVHNQAWSSYY